MLTSPHLTSGSPALLCHFDPGLVDANPSEPWLCNFTAGTRKQLGLHLQQVHGMHDSVAVHNLVSIAPTAETGPPTRHVSLEDLTAAYTLPLEDEAPDASWMPRSHVKMSENSASKTHPSSHDATFKEPPRPVSKSFKGRRAKKMHKEPPKPYLDLSFLTSYLEPPPRVPLLDEMYLREGPLLEEPLQLSLVRPDAEQLQYSHGKHNSDATFPPAADEVPTKPHKRLHNQLEKEENRQVYPSITGKAPRNVRTGGSPSDARPAKRMRLELPPAITNTHAGADTQVRPPYTYRWPPQLAPGVAQQQPSPILTSPIRHPVPSAQPAGAEAGRVLIPSVISLIVPLTSAEAPPQMISLRRPPVDTTAPPTTSPIQREPSLNDDVNGRVREDGLLPLHAHISMEEPSRVFDERVGALREVNSWEATVHSYSSGAPD
ncbi:hypothetical protein BKA93DRAFT_824285 [Sparassis latifolia]